MVGIHSPVSTNSRSGNAAGSTGIRGSIRRHPLIWFFAMASGLSWAAWTPYILSENGLGILRFSFPAVLGKIGRAHV